MAFDYAQNTMVIAVAVRLVTPRFRELSDHIGAVPPGAQTAPDTTTRPSRLFNAAR